MDEMEEMLDGAIEETFSKFSEMTPGSEEHGKQAETIVKLVDRKIKIEEFKADCDERFDNVELKKRQAKDEKLDRVVRWGLTAAGIVVPLVFSAWGVHKSMKFEKTDVITTTAGRSFFQKIVPKL